MIQNPSSIIFSMEANSKLFKSLSYTFWNYHLTPRVLFFTSLCYKSI